MREMHSRFLFFIHPRFYPFLFLPFLCFFLCPYFFPLSLTLSHISPILSFSMQKLLDESRAQVAKAETELVAVEEEAKQLRFQNDTLTKQLEVLVSHQGRSEREREGGRGGEGREREGERKGARGESVGGREIGLGEESRWREGEIVVKKKEQSRAAQKLLDFPHFTQSFSPMSDPLSLSPSLSFPRSLFSFLFLSLSYSPFSPSLFSLCLPSLSSLPSVALLHHTLLHRALN